MIDNATVEVLRECSRNSFENMPFPQVVGKLMAAGIESYHADLFRHEKTYYLPNGYSHVEADEERHTRVLNGKLVPEELDKPAVQRAVSQIQKAQIGYVEFLEQIMKAGVFSYNVYLRGQRVVYVGRTGDEHIEWFPGARS